MAGADAQILALYQRWLELREAASALDEQGPAASGTERYDQFHDEVGRLFDRADEVAHELALTPAISPDAIAAKFRVMQAEASCRDDCPAPAELDNFEKAVCDGFRGVIRDVKRPAKPASRKWTAWSLSASGRVHDRQPER